MESERKRARWRGKRRIVREHRCFMLDHALELLAQGKVSSDYVRLRGNKLKEIMGKG